MSEKELKMYYLIFTDCWKFFREFSQKVSDSDEYVQEVMKKADELYQKHGKTKFAKDQILSVVNLLDRMISTKDGEKSA